MTNTPRMKPQHIWKKESTDRVEFQTLNMKAIAQSGMHVLGPLQRDSPDGSDHVCIDVCYSAEFEVFLSFQGPYTRLKLTDCLHHFLVEAGAPVFRDDKEIRKGERNEGELLRAIETSKIDVPIFSRDYASSAWCLYELTHMVECLNRASDKVILPIFYSVNTDVVKLKTRLYIDALVKHEEEAGYDVRPWKKALTKVARQGMGLAGQRVR